MKKNSLILFFPVMMLLAASCAVNKSGLAFQGFAEAQQESAAFQKSKRKVITSVDLTMQVVQIDSANIALTTIASAYEGYFNKVGDEQTVIRVKSVLLEEALKAIGEVGVIKDQTATGIDVTDQYTDYGIRLENAQKTRERYLELLKIADSVDQIIKIEKELERLNETIDLLKGQMNRLSHLSEYATITINFQERVKPGPVGYVFVGLYKTVEWLFVRS